MRSLTEVTVITNFKYCLNGYQDVQFIAGSKVSLPSVIADKVCSKGLCSRVEHLASPKEPVEQPVCEFKEEVKNENIQAEKSNKKSKNKKRVLEPFKILKKE